MSSLLLFLTSVLLLHPVWTLDFRYHLNSEIEQYLIQTSKSNPNITHLYSIGKSVRGQELWVLALGVNPQRHVVGIPEFKYVANMHGNEVLGRELMLHLIEHLVQGYQNQEASILQLLRSTRIHILPSMNPDGFDEADTNCQYVQGRYNHNNVDLNRNFPDVFTDPQRQQLSEDQREAEVRAVMRWLRNETFVLSANLHGGALVASYAYDNGKGGSLQMGGASLTPDHDVFIHLSKEYSYNHASMHLGNSCQDSRPFRDGITNGYEWYPLAGGMQDYNYVWAQCLEVTLELSCCKFPPPDQLADLWNDNRKALLAYIRQVHLGVKGVVYDGSGVAAQDALVEVEGRKNICPFRTNSHGEYYRLLLPGNYTFTVMYPDHEVLTETLSIPYGPDSYSAATHNFRLRRSSAVTTGRIQTCPTPGYNPAVNLEGGGASSSLTWIRHAAGLSLAVLVRWVIE
ncbi:Carboxypeptidase M [Oryzias melastigma]|uniref:Carboxypeptidase M n=1 Tax=Oryzias melastigma TaxID=30732 RepID=A0A3B3CTV2_ORYME|nr:carboxypeptidase M isoform X1 [Oryzias melastigma]KAF6723315.1 Carboxypeptidase M [Oryzias melastigma]